MALPEGFVLEKASTNLPQGFVVEQQPSQQGGRSIPAEIARQVGLTGRAAYEAFTSPATMALEAVRSGVNLGAEALGSDYRMASPAAAQSQMLTEAGLPAPEGVIERAVQSGTQAMAGTAGLAKLAPNVPALAADLVRQVPASAAAGLVAQPTAEVVKEVTGSDTAATIAGILTGTIAAAGTGKAIDYKYRPRETIAQVKDRAAQAYKSVDDAGITLKPQSIQGMFKDISTALDDARMVPGTDSAREVTARLNEMSRVLGSNTSLPFSSVDKMRAMLNDLKGSKDPDVRRLGSIAVAKVDDYISNVSGKDIVAGQGGIDTAVKNVMSARKDWRNASRAQTLEDALNVAEAKALDPKASESELIRRGMINLAADKNKMKLFTPTEQNIIRSVAKGGPLDSVLSMVSRFSPLRSQLATVGTAGLYTQAPAAAIATAGAGFTADVLQGFLRKQAAQRGLQEIAAGAQAPAVNLGYRGLITGAMNPPEGSVSVEGITEADSQRLLGR
jgi:hypothetical protein